MRGYFLIALLIASLVLGLRGVAPAQASTTRILLLNLGEPEGPGALQLLNMSFVQVDATQFLTTDLNRFDVLFVGWDGDTSNPAPFNALITRQADIANWVASGHGLVALAEPNVGRFSWLPLSVTIAGENLDQVAITNPSHPVMANLTSALLSNWGLSYHNYFTTWATAYRTLAITPVHNLPLTLAANLGSGRIAITGQDPDFHLFFGHVAGAAILLRNMINWAAGVSAAPSGEASLSVTPIVTTAAKGSSFSVTVNVTNAFDLYSLDIFLTFDSSILTASVPVDSGGVLRAYCVKTTGCASVSSSVASGAGFVETNESLVGMVPGFAGNGTLFTVLFASSKSSTGTSLIHLATSSNGTGNGVMAMGTGSRIQHFSVDGVFSDNGPDLFVSIVPNSLTIGAGAGGVSQVTLYPLNGLFGTVTLNLAGVPAGVNATLNQTSLPLNGTSARTTLKILASPLASPGTFSLAVTGTITPKARQTIVRSAILEIIVPPPSPDFSLSLSSPSVTIPSGASGSVNIAISSINQFSSPVTLTLQGLPTFGGVRGSFINDPVTPAAGGSISTTLDLFVSQFLGPEIIPLTITASSPGITHTVALTLRISSFTFFPFISSLTLQPGESTSRTLSVVLINNFTGTIQLSALLVPSDVTAIFSTSTITVFPGAGNLTFTVTFEASSVAKLGSFEIVILGVSGPSFGSAAILLTINDFSIALANSEIAVPINESAIDSVSLASLNGFSGTVNLQVSGAPPGVVVSVAPVVVFLNPDATMAAQVTIKPTTAAAPGTFSLTITASSGSRTHSTELLVRVTDFALSTSVISLSLKRSQSANVTLTVSSINGFSMPVNLMLSGLPIGVTGTVIPSTVSPAGGVTTATFSLTIPKKPPTGTFQLTVTASSGSLNHTVVITLTIL